MVGRAMTSSSLSVPVFMASHTSDETVAKNQTEENDDGSF
jgi:hypothetical protein